MAIISIVAQLIPTYHPNGDNKKLKISKPKTPPTPWIIVLRRSNGFWKYHNGRIIIPAIIKRIKNQLPI